MIIVSINASSSNLENASGWRDQHASRVVISAEGSASEFSSEFRGSAGRHAGGPGSVGSCGGLAEPRALCPVSPTLRGIRPGLCSARQDSWGALTSQRPHGRTTTTASRRSLVRSEDSYASTKTVVP